MEPYKIYCKLKSDLKIKMELLLSLKQTTTDQQEIVSLEIAIEEDLSALNMVFNHLIS